MRRRRRGTSKEFLWPFILMIGVGLVIVLLIQLVFSFFGQKEAEMRNKANFYIDRGSAEVMEWGAKDWSKAYDSGVILEGDSVQTKASSRGFLALYNGTEIRFSENTRITVATLESKGDTDYLVLDMNKGEIWVDQLMNEKGSVDVLVQIDNMNIYSVGTEFAVLNREEQVVRVVEGNLRVELVDGDIVIDEVTVGVGQELSMSASDVEDLLARRNMEFLAAIDDEWEDGDFYEWNSSAAEQSEAEELIEQVEEQQEDGDLEGVEEQEILEEEIEEEEVDYEDPVLTLTNPEYSPYLLEGDQIYIQGEVEGYASKIVVRSYTEEGTAEDYQLGLFEAGDEEFSYNAAHIYENLHEGENEYLITAYDYYGFEADSLSVTIDVPEGQGWSEAEAQEDEDGEQEEVEDQQEDESGEEEAEEEVPELSCELTAPVIVDIDWEEWDGEVFVLDDADAVRIDGTVECAYGILVNEYQLTLFEPGDTTWAYVAAVEYNNLFEGEHEYEVFAIDEEGNRSDPVYFWIDYVVEEEIVD